MAQVTSYTAIASGAIEYSVVHSLNNSAAVISAAVPSWNTTVWVASRAANDLTVYFGTQVGSGGGFLDWRVQA